MTPRAGAVALLILAAGTIGGTAEPQPVLVELFTSEGCSSCPPADALLERLDHAPVIVLSEHVDYWNSLGWKDPYSSAAFSARQELYARRFRTSGPYTPQMVVDGRTEFVGNDDRAAESAIRNASRETKLPVRITRSPDGSSATIAVDPSPHKADVYVAYAADSATSDVLRGENKNRRLHHVAVVKPLKQLGRFDQRSGFRATTPLENGLRLIVFVQEPGNGPVWGAAMLGAKRE